jgi:DNA-binding NarL/FixJ family response regulator
MILEGDSPVPFLGDSDDAMNVTREFLALDSPAPSPAARAPAGAALTTRETEVLSLLAGGRTGKEIAAELTISLSTVQRHIANIYTKIGARSRVDAAAYALGRGLVRPRDP